MSSDGEPNDELTIPTIDLAELVHHDRATRERAAAAIREGFGTYGLVYVANHGVDFALRDRLFERFVALTEAPPEDKEPLNRSAIWYQRGWTPPNTEKAVVAGGQPDFKECYFAAPVPTDPSCGIEYPQLFADNVWPADDDGSFAEDYLALGRQIHEAGLSLLHGVAHALGLFERTFERSVEGGAHVFRLLRYLPVSAEQLERGVVWGEEHTDFNLLTLLPGGRFHDPDGQPCGRPDGESGLYLRTRPSAEHPRGRMVRGKAPEGCIVAQVGQQLEILTGGELLATPHVITPPKAPGFTRVSGAHFIHLHPHQMVFPLEPFRTDATLEAYAPPVLAGTYSIKTLVDIGLAPASALDGLGYRHYGRLAGFRAEEAKPAT
jgi:isopenicillin N synthase-like dioxygenase